MKKSIKRTLSLLLALTMVLSLGLPAYAVDAPEEDEVVIAEEPVELPAQEPVEEPVEKPVTLPIGAGKQPGIIEEDEFISEDLIVDIVDEETAVEEEVAPAKVFAYSESATGFTVEVSAPAGALPLGTEMFVDRLVDLSAVQAAVDNAEDLNGSVQLAADISFWLEGKEIEPAEGAKLVVRMSAPEIQSIAAPVVIHIPDGENSVPEIVEQLNAGDVMMADTVSFETGSFSVYAVIDGESDEEARAAVEFYGLDDNAPVATYYVKNSDVLLGDGERDHEKSYIEDIITDPGIGGQVPDGQIFVGWYIGESKDFTVDTKPLTIDGVRKYVAEQAGTFVEGETTIKVYAMLFRVYTVTYLDEQNISIGSDELYTLPSVTSVDYKVSKTYDPVDPTKNFEGWITDNDSAISNAMYEGAAKEEPYPMDTTMTISGNIVFTVQAPKGHWLVFDENGKGATYIAPQFVKGTNPTVEPTIEMKRLGYEFKGWYTERYADDATADESKKFQFGGSLNDIDGASLTIYAKWSPVTRANYTVIYWQQNVAGTAYDFVTSQNINGTVGTAINVTSSGSTISVTGANNYTVAKGFSYDHADTGKTVAPEGNTVVNVYIKRNEYTLTFIDNSSSSTISFVAYGYDLEATMGDEVTNNNNITTLERNKKTISGYDVSYYSGGMGGTRYCIKLDGKWYRVTGTYSEYLYDATSISSVPSGPAGTVKTITALYEQNISSYFPIVGDNGRTYDQGERWMPGDNTQNPKWIKVMVYIDTMPNESIEFTLDEADRPLKTMYYYVEALPTDTNTVTRGSVKYTLYNTISARYNGVTSEDFVALDGFAKGDAASSVNGSALTPDSNDFYIYSTTENQSIYFFYTRLKYNINFMDGRYFDGNNNPLIEEYPSQGQWKEVKDVVYGSDISSYNKPGDDYYEPDGKYDGFVFEGWYIDDACTTPYTFANMTKGGLTVYAKWRQIQYRVFLHPNAKLPDGTNDNTLSWGDESQPEDKKQAMNFRVTYQGKVSMPTGLRDEYEFIGWFTDAATTKPYNMDTKLTEATVTADYDKSLAINYTDKMNKFGEIEGTGYNSDLTGWDDDGDASTPGKDRFWITRKLDLYGKWSAILTGAQGIGVIYDVNGGSDAPSDTRKYKDNVDALARPACTPPVGERFLYWVVQKWNGTEYVDTETIVYPGAKFTVLKSLAKETDLTPDAEDYVEGEVYKAYTMQLRAQYGPGESSKNTFIHWYQNDKDPSERLYEDKDLMINEGVDIYTLTEGIPTRFGYKFLGWARLSEHEQFDAETGDATDEAITYHDVTAADLYLKWIVDNEETGAGHYEAQKSDGSWVTVTQVAADEAKPYQAFYAVWDADYFYVYHSGIASNNVEKHKVEEAKDGGFDLTANIPDGKLYGGYYKDYAGKPDGFDPTALTYSDDGIATASGTVYDGSTVVFQASDAYAKDGNHTGLNMIPEAGKVYYVKEVPAEKFLQHRMKYTYSTATKKIGAAWLFTNADDNNYQGIGFMIKEENLGAVVDEITLTALNTKMTKTFKVADKDMFGIGSKMGYKLVYWDPSVLAPDVENAPQIVKTDLLNGESVVNFWITPDGLQVFNSVSRSYTGMESVTTADKTETNGTIRIVEYGTT